METLSAVSSKNTDPKSVRGGRPKNHPGDMKLMWYLASFPCHVMAMDPRPMNWTQAWWCLTAGRVP